MLPFLHALEQRAEKLKKNAGVRISPWPVFILGVSLLFLAFVLMTNIVEVALSMALFLAPLWLPFLIGFGAWRMWVILKRSEFIASQKYVLLEIRPPRNIIKTPLAMEAVLSGLHLNPGEGTWYKKYIQGGVRPWWSLEIASLEGQVRFFIWTRANFRRVVETQFYAQYPGTQILEVPDYTRLISGKSEEWGIWGCQFGHTKEDPLPIKTYVDYGLDKVQKEPEQVDPLANLIELMGSMRKGEFLWLQLAIRVHKGEKYQKGEYKGKGFKDWKDEAQALIEEIRTSSRDTFIDAQGNEQPGFPNMTKGQSEKIAAMERNVSKLPFDVGARGIYIAEPSRFDPANISALVGIFKQFSSEGWNGFKPMGGMTVFDDYPWEIGVEKLKKETAEGLIDAYRRRQFFHEPYVEEAMVMSTEELATIFHVPSATVETPSLPRIQSVTSEAPSNLPT